MAKRLRWKEGLTAFVRHVTAIPDIDRSHEFQGWNFPGEVPPMPELPAG